MSEAPVPAENADCGKPAARGARPPWRPRFGLGCIMLVMLVCSVTAASASYVIRGVRGGGESHLFFLLLTFAAPQLLLVIVSLLWRLFSGAHRK